MSVTVEILVVDCVQRLTCVDFTYNIKVFLTEKYSSVYRAETDVSLTRLGADGISRTAGVSIINVADVEVTGTPPVEVPRRTSVTKLIGVLYSWEASTPFC